VLDVSLFDELWKGAPADAEQALRKEDEDAA